MTIRSYLLAGTLMLASSCYNHPIDNNEQLISLNGTFSLQTILRKIESQTGKRFFYANSDLNDQEQLTVNWDKRPLSNVLTSLLKEKKLHWNAKEKIVVLCSD
jgi:hypothetical protein